MLVFRSNRVNETNSPVQQDIRRAVLSSTVKTGNLLLINNRHFVVVKLVPLNEESVYIIRTDRRSTYLIFETRKIGVMTSVEITFMVHYGKEVILVHAFRTGMRKK